MWVLLPITLFDLCRLEDSYGTVVAALLAPAAHPPVLTETAAPALLAPAALPPVLADADDTARETALPPCLHSKRRRSQLRSSRRTLRQRS